MFPLLLLLLVLLQFFLLGTVPAAFLFPAPPPDRG